MSTELTAEEQAWEDSGRDVLSNPVVLAVVETIADAEQGTAPEEDGLETAADAIQRWRDYLTYGDQEISWHEPILIQANDYVERFCRAYGIQYTPGLTKPRN